MSAHKKPRAVSLTLQQLMVQAVLMEIEASERYEEFADTMQAHNNPEVAQMFRKLSVIERKHADQAMAEMGWAELPEMPVAQVGWEGFEAPETVPIDSIHYLMQPYHVLQLALEGEQRAERFFEHLAKVSDDEAVAAAAREMRDEEREHVELIRAWMARVPQPDSDWSVDPDPPRYSD